MHAWTYIEFFRGAWYWMIYCIVLLHFKEKCTEIIAFAAAEMRDARQDCISTCPVLEALASVDPKKSDSESYFSLF